MKKRPIGITILAILSIFGGIGIIVVQVIFSGELEKVFESHGLSSLATLLNFAILSVWAFAAGIGMWLGRKLGWWLGSLYLSYSVLRNVNAIFTIMDIVAQNHDQVIDTTKYYIKHIGRVIFHSLLVAYYFKNNVMEFFQISTNYKKKRFWKFIGITLLIFIAMILVTQL